MTKSPTEWTAATINTQVGYDADRQGERETIAKFHNAALAAEREKVETRIRLYWIKQLENQRPVQMLNHGTGEITTAPSLKVTTDEIADRLLNEKIEADYPNIKALEKRLGALEDQLVSELLNPSTPEE